ncbi:MAG: AAA family ATPase [Planctomycetaceae bacterium]
MYSSLKVDGYRGFSDYLIHELKTVNLLVGRNNTGKTSLLEAALILATEGDPSTFARIASQRGEEVAVDPDDESPRPDILPDISHFFYGHEIAANASIEITDTITNAVKVEVVSRDEIVNQKQPTLFAPDSYYRVRRRLNDWGLLLSLKSFSEGSALDRYMAMLETGGFDPRAVLHPGRAAAERIERMPSVTFIGAESVDPKNLRAMWDQTIEQGIESGVVEALQILDATVESVQFRTSDIRSRSAKSGVLIGHRGQKRRVPLGSLGDGMRRLLSLALALNHTRDGVLLVDEIDTGLHWTAMPEMWRLVIETAIKNDTQVFATTHSADCIRGLSWACRQHPELAGHISLQTIDPELSESIPSTAEQLHISMDQDIEVR